MPKEILEINIFVNVTYNVGIPPQLRAIVCMKDAITEGTKRKNSKTLFLKQPKCAYSGSDSFILYPNIVVLRIVFEAVIFEILSDLFTKIFFIRLRICIDYLNTHIAV